jgi:hypothetical protein
MMNVFGFFWIFAVGAEEVVVGRKRLSATRWNILHRVRHVSGVNPKLRTAAALVVAGAVWTTVYYIVISRVGDVRLSVGSCADSVMPD